jgi:hypothetical protein
MAARNGVELPVVYATLALTLAATGAGKYKIGPSIPGRLAAVGALVGGIAAGALVAKMVTSKPVPADAAPADAAPADAAPAEAAPADAAAEPPAEA